MESQNRSPTLEEALRYLRSGLREELQNTPIFLHGPPSERRRSPRYHPVSSPRSGNSILKNTELQRQIDDLREKEQAIRVKAEEYKLKCSTLALQVTELQKKNTSLQNKCTTLQNTCEGLSKERKGLEKDLITAEGDVKSYLEKYQTQEIELLEKTTKLEVLEAENKLHLNTISEYRNTIYILQKKIRVFCRVRPRISTELSKGLCSIAFPDECTTEVVGSEVTEASTRGGGLRGTREEFTFDKVFSPDASQEEIFEEISFLVESALEGYNICIFAYGQTGSGKTYTMEGCPGDEYEGIIPRTVKHIFEVKQNLKILGWDYRIQASFLEIYNEHIVDLLDPQQKTHEIRMVDSKGSDIYVTNLRIEEVNSPKELENCFKIAQKNRAVATTQFNKRSSRSHSVARIKLIGTHNTRNEVRTGTLNLIDLAGSERLQNAEEARTAETKNINKSLSELTNVILAILKKQGHVPYRNSKLTHLLMPSLGGNSKIVILLNISPLSECFDETVKSLRFASNVNNCKTGNIRRTRAALTIAP